MKAANIGLLVLLLTQTAAGEAIEITDLTVDKTALRPGETFTVTVAIGENVEIAVNGRRLTNVTANRPIYPGRPNTMTIRPQPSPL